MTGETTLTMAVPTRKLDCQTLSHEIGTIFNKLAAPLYQFRRDASKSLGYFRRYGAMARQWDVRKARRAKLVEAGTDAGVATALTRNNVTSIQRILVLDEAEATHKLDLGDLSGAMFGKVGLNIGLGGCSSGLSVSGDSIRLIQDQNIPTGGRIGRAEPDPQVPTEKPKIGVRAADGNGLVGRCCN